MKESIVGFIIIISLCSISYLTSQKTSDFCNELQNNVSECISAINEENWNKSKLILQEAKKDFEQKSSILKTFCVHKDINEIANALSYLNSSVISQDKVESLLHSSYLINVIKVLSKNDTLNLENILWQKKRGCSKTAQTA